MKDSREIVCTKFVIDKIVYQAGSFNYIRLATCDQIVSRLIELISNEASLNEKILIKPITDR